MSGAGYLVDLIQRIISNANLVKYRTTVDRILTDDGGLWRKIDKMVRITEIL